MRGLPWLLVVGVGLTAGPAPAAETVMGEAQLVTLENGLRLLLAPDAKAAAVDVAVWYDSGTRHERVGKTGMAHLFEHLMFRGSSRYGPGEHGRLIRAEGGSSGAYVTHDFTCFYQTLPPDALELAFQLEADRMTGLVITQEVLDAERQQVAGERAQRVSTIARGLDRLYAMAWPAHPYGWPPFGLPEDVQRLTVQDCREFYRRRFGPDRALVTVAGSFSPENALAWARKHFGPLKPGGGRAQPLPPERPQTGERRASERLEAGARVVMVGWRVPPRSHPDWPALSLLATVLTRASTAPLARALITSRPLCLSIQGDLDSRRDASLFYLAASVAPGADSAEVEERLFGEVGRLMVEPVPAEELERAKRQTETAVWLGLQTSRTRAQAIGTALVLTGDHRDVVRQLERVQACTPEDLRRAARLLDPARRNVVWMLPAAEAAPARAASGRP